VLQILRSSDESPPVDAWMAHRGGRLAAAMRVQVLPGRTAVVSPPRVAENEPASLAERLLAAAMADLAERDVKLVQALFDEVADTDAKLLGQADFRHVCDLLDMVSLRQPYRADSQGTGLELVPYLAELHGRLVDVVRQTYTGSLDCPAVEGLRAVDDVLAGYRASGQFRPELWLLARRAGADVGCLIVADFPSEQQCELSYLGVIPQARGQGIGLALTRHAQQLASALNRQRLVLAVDAANAPALAIYERAGFIQWNRRSAWVRVL
jgi:mycothiol synthase